jgi:hypothetical protein
MYIFTQENVVRREWWYVFMSEVEWMLYGENDDMFLCQKLHYKLIFTWVVRTRFWWRCDGYWLDIGNDDYDIISQSTCANAKLNTIVKFRKYRRFHERHHFILITMEVHDTCEHDMNRFIKKCAHPFHDRHQKIIYLCLFAFSFSNNVLILFFNVLQLLL